MHTPTNNSNSHTQLLAVPTAAPHCVRTSGPLLLCSNQKIWPSRPLLLYVQICKSANQPPRASVSGRADHGSVCYRDYTRPETSLACIHRAEEPTKQTRNRLKLNHTPLILHNGLRGQSRLLFYFLSLKKKTHPKKQEANLGGHGRPASRW